MTRVITDAESVEALAAEWPVNDLPSVGTEDAPSMANYTFTIVADSGYESTTEGRCSAKQYGAVIYALHNDDSYADQRDKLASERDALAGRVRELEAERDTLRAAAKQAKSWIEQQMAERGCPDERIQDPPKGSHLYNLRAALSTTPESKP